MPIGSITQHIDLPQAALMVFFLAFLATVWFLRRLDKREGYPMVRSPFDHRKLLGYPSPPPPKTYRLNEGGTTAAPHDYPQPPPAAQPLYRFDGTPLTPVGNPLLSPLGPGAWVMRRDEPMLTENGEIMLQPLRLLGEWSIEQGEADPRGMKVFDRRWVEIGTVHDVWVDRSIKILRLFEVELHPKFADPGSARPRVLVPIFHTAINERAREIRVTALEAHQFAAMPLRAADDRITAREDDRLNAYYAAGYFHRDTPATNRPRGFLPVGWFR